MTRTQAIEIVAANATEQAEDAMLQVGIQLAGPDRKFIASVIEAVLETKDLSDATLELISRRSGS